MSRRLGSRLAVGEMPVGRGRFDLAAPHLLDGGEIDFVDGVVDQPTSLSNSTMVAMPAAIRST